MSGPLVVGVDLGTSSLKCGLFDLGGECARAARIPYPSREGEGAGPDVSEQDAADWWDALKAGLLAASRGIDPQRIAAIGVGGHAPSPVFVDAELEAVGPVLAWADRRSAGLRDEIVRKLGRPLEGARERLAAQVAARAKWLSLESPERFARATRVLQSGDYLVARLTGECVWTAERAPEVFAAAGVPHELVPPRSCRPGERVGRLTPGAAGALGLAAGVPVAACGLDSLLASIGSGMRKPGDACLDTGSSSVVALLARPPATGRFEWLGLPLLSQPIGTGARLLERVHAQMGEGPSLVDRLVEVTQSEAAALEGSLLLGLAESIERGEAGRVLRDLSARYAPAPLLGALFDAITLAQRRVLEALEERAGPALRVRVVGGLAARAELNQRRADVLGRAIEVARFTDSGAFGAAILAAAASGLCSDPQEAASRMLQPGRSFAPRPAIAAAHDASYRRLRTPEPSDAGDRLGEARHERGTGARPVPAVDSMHAPLEQSLAVHARARRVLWKGGSEATQHEALHGDGYPRFLARADGCFVWDVDGNRYVDYLMAWGAVFLGHRFAPVEREVARQLESGAMLDLSVESEVALAERLVAHIPGVELVRFLVSGSEAMNAAIRVARAATGREIVVQCGFHGWLDWCQNAHPAGVLPATLSRTLPFGYNDVEALRELFARHPDGIACVVLEPVKDEEPQPGFLQAVRELAHRHGSLLVFDEVKTGFRLGPGGAQAHLGVVPDLSVFSKALANGYPLAAVAGRAEVFGRAEAVWISGTYHGWPPAIAAAHATLTALEREPVVARVWALGERLRAGFDDTMARCGLQARLGGLPPMPQVVCPDEESATLRRLFSALVRRGHFIHPIRPWFLSAAHDDELIEATLEDIRAAADEVVAG